MTGSCVQKIPAAGMCFEQRLHLATEAFVVSTGLPQKNEALIGLTVQRFVKELVNALPSLRSHKGSVFVVRD